jgi:hypothetical protein
MIDKNRPKHIEDEWEEKQVEIPIYPDDPVLPTDERPDEKDFEVSTKKKAKAKKSKKQRKDKSDSESDANDDILLQQMTEKSQKLFSKSELMNEMQDEYGLRLKRNIADALNVDQAMSVGHS